MNVHAYVCMYALMYIRMYVGYTHTSHMSILNTLHTYTVYCVLISPPRTHVCIRTLDTRLSCAQSVSDMNRHEGRTTGTAEAESGRGPTVFAHPLRAKALVLSLPVRPGRTAECHGAAQPAPCLVSSSRARPCQNLSCSLMRGIL